ncbi:hypothetical protein CYLTODRAFT_417365 [Cylindrobasidium torrendii FP15055 ss-10]|uniref:Uncharacterized protein n=1 Tax=Cylindrobasidium torrendii FP15055 ss-10 TaxID=1314674 RepID=A0A0D7BU21_9AGAR|nr:hypothetical protein CYLTODRAFT_417365 [Cylindrobasidium torrendii FP15055 ss-10]
MYRWMVASYRKSDIVLDELARLTGAYMVGHYDPYRSAQDGQARAGDRAPDVACLELSRKTLTMYDLFDNAQPLCFRQIPLPSPPKPSSIN